MKMLVNKVENFKKNFENNKNLKQAKILSRYFKTAKGEYGEGDIFWGISVLKQRKLIKKFKDLSLNELQKLLNSKVHELRFSALLILIDKYKKSDLKNKEKIALFYLKNIKNINNWDLVDLSSHHILGDYLWNKDRKIIYNLAKSNFLWSRRIAVVSTFYFIKKNDFKDILKLSKILINDPHDLIHKALGWMLREVGKRDIAVLEKFLWKNKNKMPRVMLRYAIEKFPKYKRSFFLKRKI